MKIFILDTYYPDFLNTMPPVDGQSTYDVELRKILDRGFGTADFYSHALGKLGWETFDSIGNSNALLKLWISENDVRSDLADRRHAVLAQIDRFNPDIVFIQDLSFFDSLSLKYLRMRYILAGQCSCPMPASENVSQFHILFTSFPHYVERFEALGVESHYLPLAFDPRMKPEDRERDIDIAFVGGVGRQSHWRAGTDALEAVASSFEDRFHWYGYGLDNLPSESALRKCYRGPAWGRDQYAIYGRAKIVVNRHGEVAEGIANNLRMFEATGCGALLMTEDAPNLASLFPPFVVGNYRDAYHLIVLIDALLTAYSAVGVLAARTAQMYTLKHHTYDQRMQSVSDILAERVRSGTTK